MSVYAPDRWKLIRITFADGEVLDKVLGGWQGGYIQSGGWRLNSGVVGVSVVADNVTFHGYSGSEYVCRLSDEGMTPLMRDVLHALQVRFAEDDGTLDPIDLEESGWLDTRA